MRWRGHWSRTQEPVQSEHWGGRAQQRHERHRIYAPSSMRLIPVQWHLLCPNLDLPPWECASLRSVFSHVYGMSF